MFIFLVTGILKLNQIKDAENILLINMSIFFITPVVKSINFLAFLEIG
jgi:putative effector of murein hydrolase LrgA (UPF0299 family)